MAGIKFDFNIGDSNVEAKLKDIRNSVNEASKVIQNLGKNFDVSTPKAKIEALKTVINDMTAVMQSNEEQMRKWEEDARKAFNDNDIEGFNAIISDMQDLGNEMQSLQGETEEYVRTLEYVEGAAQENGWSEMNEDMEENSNILVKMLGGQEKYNEVMQNLPAPLKNAAEGVMNLTKAGKAFIATPLGAVLGAIILALTAVKTYFESSAEGQMKMTKATGYLNGVLTQLKEILIKVGEYLVNAFQNPKDAIADLWKFIKDQFIVRLQALGGYFKTLGSLISNVFKGDKEGIKQDFKTMTNYVAEMVTGVDDAGKKMVEFAEKTHEAAVATSELEVRERKLAIEREQWAKEEARMDEQIAKARMDMYSAESSMEEREKAAAKAQELIAQKYAKKIEFARRELAIASELADLSTNDQATYDDLERKQAAVIELEAQRTRELASFERRSATFTKRAMQQEQLLADLKAKNASKEVEMMEEGYDKRIAQAMARYQQQVASIDKQKIQIETEGGMELSEEESEEFRKSYELAWAEFVKEVDKAKQDEISSMNNYLREYGNYEEKRLAIKQEYEKKIIEAGTEGEKLTLQKSMEKDLASLDVEAGKTTTAIGRLFSNLKNVTSKELEQIADKGEKALDFLTKGEWNEEQAKILGITKEMFDYYTGTPEALESVSNAFEKVKKAAEDCRNPIKNVTEGIKELFQAKDANQANEAIKLIGNGVSELTQATGFLSESLREAFSTGKMDAFADTLDNVGSVLNKTVEGLKTGGQVGGAVGAVIGGAIGLISSTISAINKRQDQKKTDAIAEQEKRIKALSEGLQNLQKISDDVYSNEKANVLRQQNELIEKQIEALVKEIDIELSRKKVDEQAIEGRREQMRQLRQQIEDNEEAAVDAIFGSNISSAIESFASSYSSAWESGTSKAQSAKEQVRQMMKDMVKESIKGATESSGAMNAIRQKLTEFYADNVFDVNEQHIVENMAMDLQKTLDEKFGWADNLMAEQSAEMQASGRSVSTMTQEQASSLEGRFTAMQVSSDRSAQATVENTIVARQMLAIVTTESTILSDIRSNIAISNSYLEDIANYNKTMSKWGDTIKRIADNTDKL